MLFWLIFWNIWQCFYHFLCIIYFCFLFFFRAFVQGGTPYDQYLSLRRMFTSNYSVFSLFTISLSLGVFLFSLLLLFPHLSLFLFSLFSFFKYFLIILLLYSYIRPFASLLFSIFLSLSFLNLFSILFLRLLISSSFYSRFSSLLSFIPFFTSSPIRFFYNLSLLSSTFLHFPLSSLFSALLPSTCIIIHLVSFTNSFNGTWNTSNLDSI